jgi:hypothetical protein
VPSEVPEDERIYITELSRIINRQVNTIRKWERLGVLPEKLCPQRGFRNRRYWTHAQVHGRSGILKWMAKNDMRPGNALAHRDSEAQHVEHLRKPKYLPKRLLNNARQMTRHRASLEEILEEIWPQTKYASKQNLEVALRRYFKRQGWPFPPYEDNERPGVIIYDD